MQHNSTFKGPSTVRREGHCLCVVKSYLLGVSENERKTSNYCQCLRKKKGKGTGEQTSSSYRWKLIYVFFRKKNIFQGFLEISQPRKSSGLGLGISLKIPFSSMRPVNTYVSKLISPLNLIKGRKKDWLN